MEGIQVSVSKAGPRNDIAIIKVGGYIDTTTSAELERSLEALLRSGSYNIVVDLADVDYISSAGWGIFISEIKGIREKGGDLKLANMIPDVYEVFELLEFHYILKAFDSVEDAIKDFEVNSRMRKEEMPVQQEAVISQESPVSTTTDVTYRVTTRKSLEDKVKSIILENPDASLLEIKKTLNTERYGFTKIGVIDTWKLLKRMGLASRKKRIEFFRKQAFQS